MEIIKLFRLNIFMLVVKFLRFTIWLFYKMEIIKLSLVNIFVPVTSCINLVLGCVCVSFFSGIRPNQLFRPYLDDIYEFPLKLLH